MKLPNGYGNISKLPGNRRTPFRVRKTVGWKWYDRLEGCFLDDAPPEDEALQVLDDGKLRFQSKQQYVTVGYYETRQKALQALAAYNEDPYDLHFDTITFAEVYERWSEKHFEGISDSNVKGYKAAFNVCQPIHNMKVVDIKVDHLQQVVDDSGKNSPTLKKVKILFGMIFDYAVMHEIVGKEKRDMVKYVDISKAGNPNSYNRKPFSDSEIDVLWKHQSSEYVSVILILIYTGCRISELLNLTKDNINLDERWFYIGKAKTEAGIREVPIAEKVVPFFEHWMEKDCDHLICTPEEEPFQYKNYYDSYWKPIVDELGMNTHRPHDTRHTCVSLLTAAGVDERIIRKIVGHKGQGVTETVYTHLELPLKLEAINRI